MTQKKTGTPRKIRALYIGAKGGDTFDPSQIEQQSRAVKAAGGEVVRFGGSSTGELIEALKDVDVAMSQGHKVDSAVFEHMGNHGRCKGLVSFGHGFDGIDTAAAARNGVVLANTASFGTEEVSNQAMMHLLICARKFVKQDKMVRQGVWDRKGLAPMGHVSGQTLGIIGLGDIGRAVARKAQAFRLHVIGYDPYIASWDFKEYAVEQVATLEDLCRRSDYVTLHVYLNEETRHMFSSKHFDHMKPTAYLINCSRGGVVDEKALIEALQKKKIAGAGLDVFEQEPTPATNPLLKMDNVSVTNHYASYSEVAWERAQTQMGEEAVRIAMGHWPMSLINPEVKHYAPPRKAAKTWEAMKADMGLR